MNIPDEQEIIALHKRYAPDEDMFNLVYDHCKIVRDIAFWCADNVDDSVDKELLEAQCLLHDIASYGFMHASYDRKTYMQHALLGSKIVETEGFDTRISKAIETHVLMGITKEEILENGWRIPAKDFIPSTIEARILCYADRFHSKTPMLNSFQSFSDTLEETLPLQAAKFKSEAEYFGIPDLEFLSKKYGHPIR